MLDISLYHWAAMRLLRQDGYEFEQLFRAIWQSGVLALTAMTLVYSMSKTAPFRDFYHWTYDFAVIHSGLSKPTKDIILVDFDDDTFHRVKKFPIPRDLIAQVVSKISDQKPRIIGMDILLSEARTPEEDKAMQDALTKAGNVILARQDGFGEIPTEMPLRMFCQPEHPDLASGFCIDGTPGGLGYAAINLPTDDDGYIRESELFAGDPPNQAPAFAVTMAQQYTGEAIKPVDARRFSFLGKKLFYDLEPKSYQFFIGSWAREPVPVVSAWKVFDGVIPANTFTDKLVLMGQSSDAARDRHYTPLYRYSVNDRRYSMGGTQVHAAAIRSLLEGTVVHPCPGWLRWGVVALVSWIASFAILWLRTSLGMGTMVTMMVIPPFISLVLFAKLRFWMPFLGQELGLLITLPLTLFVQFLSERVLAQEARSQRMQLMKLFSSYVDPAVAGTIWERRDEVSLNGEERIATVMFTDIRSFTALSAGKPPAEVLTWLNQYMTAMDEVIRLHGGFLNKFIGDGLMIIFGLPLSHGVRQDAGRGMHAALAMLKRVELLNQENAKHPERPQLRIGVGIHTGPLMAGSIGSANRQEYSVIGETVNLASRLESLNKPFKTEILMSQATHDLLVDQYTGFEALGEAKVAGFDQPVAVFTIRSPA